MYLLIPGSSRATLQFWRMDRAVLQIDATYNSTVDADSLDGSSYGTKVSHARHLDNQTLVRVYIKLPYYP